MEANAQKTAILVSHTHWDRAWYLTFPTFRFHLVRLVDRLLELLETRAEFHSFTLDGQTILLDDYLQIRPENRPRLEALIRSGRLICGPWYVSPDLFLISPESVIRNLQTGARIAESFGGSMQEGYVPDPFGHFAQLPQVLNGFGMRSFLFMRGLSAEDKSRAGSIFLWRSPDGSDVLTTYLADGYFNAGSLGYPSVYGRHEGLCADLDLARTQIRSTIDKFASLQKERTFLLNNGFDHMPEQADIPDLLRDLDGTLDGLELRHGTFSEYMDAIRAEDRPKETVEGDLLGNVDQPILLSVYSTRVYLKQLNHRAQSLLERIVEPMDVFASTLPVRKDTGVFLDAAWKQLMENHPHDDICGCSHDGVHQDNEARFRQVTDTAEAVLVEALEAMRLSGLVPPPSTSPRQTELIAFNPHPWPVATRLRARVLLPEGDDESVSVFDASGAPLPTRIDAIHPRVLRNHYLEQTWGRAFDLTFDAILPPLGYQLFHVAPSTTTSPALPAAPASSPLAALRDSLFLHYEHDLGDTYSFGPDPSGVQFRSNGEAIIVPRRPKSAELVRMPIRWTSDIHHDSLHLNLAYRNEAENGRMRLAIPLPTLPESFVADAHFRLAERHCVVSDTPESDPERYTGYPGEFEYPTQHFKDFLLVPFGDRTLRVSAHGLHEAELTLIDDVPVLAITLHRAVGELSVGGGRIRRVQAGPQIPTPGAQCLRELEFELHLGFEAEPDDRAARRAVQESHPVWVRELPYLPHVPYGDTVPRSSSMLEITHPSIALSAFKLDEATGDRILRVFNLSSETIRSAIRIQTESGTVCETDLREAWTPSTARTFTGNEIAVELGPHKIQTLRIRP